MTRLIENICTFHVELTTSPPDHQISNHKMKPDKRLGLIKQIRNTFPN